MNTNVHTLLERAEFVVDAEGAKKAVVLDYALWEDLLELLEDMEDSAEMEALRMGDEEAISWEEAKAELRAGGVDV